MTVPCEYSWQTLALVAGGWFVAGILICYGVMRKGRG